MYLPIRLDRSLPESLQDQLFVQLRQMIVNGNIKPNTRVIATRFLAEQIDVSRTTVLLAYERLVGEGYLETRPGVGTFVTTDLPDDEIRAPKNKKRQDIERQASLYPPPFLPEQSARREKTPCRIDFSTFHADPALLPVKAWGQKMQMIAEHHRPELAEYPPQGGIESLRLAITDWLALHRDIAVAKEQVIIVTGRLQARHLVARLFLRSGGNVVIEAPCLLDTATLFETSGAHLIPVPVDGQGIITDLLPEGRAQLAYVTPNHQLPLGSTMSLPRRERLIEWARKSGSYIIEDDCDGKFRYTGTPLPTLAALDPYGLVFHLGTFSKSLGAGLCIGYLVVPPEFIEPIISLKTMLSKGCSWLEQRVLSDFMGSGDYDHHLRRMRKVYIDRRDCLIEALKNNFGDVQLIGAETGTQLTWILPEKFPSAQELQKRAFAQGISLRTLADDQFVKQQNLPNHYLERALILSYATLDKKKIREGIALLSQMVGQ